MADDTDLGKLTWVIDADDTAFNRKIDAAEARARAFDGRVNGTGGFGGAAGSANAAAAATFGGIELTSGNYTVSPKGPQVPIAAPDISRRQADETRLRFESALAKYNAGVPGGSEFGPGYSTFQAALIGGASAESLRMYRQAMSGNLRQYAAFAASASNPLAVIPPHKLGFGSAVLANPLARYGGLAPRTYSGDEVSGAAADGGDEFEGEVVGQSRGVPLLGRNTQASGGQLFASINIPGGANSGRRAYSDEFRQSVLNRQWFPARQQNGGSSDRLHHYSQTGLRIIGYSVAGLHELSGISRASQEGDYERSIAASPIDVLQADVNQQQRQFTGVFASLGGLYLDGLGHGPASYAADAKAASTTYERQTALRQQQRALYFSNQGYAAASSGDSFEAARLQARAAYYPEAETLKTQIGEAEKGLAAKTTVPFQRGKTNYSGTYITRDPDVAEHQDDAVTGEARKSLIAQRDSWKARLDEIGNTFNSTMVGVQRGLENRDYDASRLDAQGIGLNAGRAGLSLERQFGYENQSMKAERDSDLAQYKFNNPGYQEGYDKRSASWKTRLDVAGSQNSAAITQRDIAYAGALNDATASSPIASQRAALQAKIGGNIAAAGGLFSTEGLKQAILGVSQLNQLGRQFSQQTGLIDIAQAGQATFNARLLSHNPIGAQSAEITAGAIGRAQSFVDDGRGKQAKAELENALGSEQVLKQNYLEGFRAVQEDFRLNPAGPRDQDGGDALKSIKEDTGTISQFIQNIKII